MFEVSVVLVSDHGAGGPEGHRELIETLEALAEQQNGPNAEILLIENERVELQVPSVLQARLPGLRMVRSKAAASYELKNEGMRAASADIAVILDADCRPAPDWLARIAGAWRRYPDATAISGHTQYEGRSGRDRMLALLGRSYLNPGGEGETEFVSNNNASWKRSAYLEHPLPEGLGPFAGRIQSEAIRRAGGRFYFDPSIRVVHGFEGWAMERDIRWNIGYGTVVMRLHDPSMPYAHLVRLGRAAIPAIALGKTWNSWWDCLRCHRFFGVRAWEVVGAVLLAPILVALETPGMWAAYTQSPAPPTEYR